MSSRFHWDLHINLLLDHAVSNFPRHLTVRHLMLRQIGSGELGAVDIGGELILASILKRQILELGNDALPTLLVGRDLAEVDHLAWLVS